MFVMNCPHCGAQAQIPPSVPSYTCHYCQRAFNVAGPNLPPGYGAPPPAQQPSNEIPQIVVVHAPSHSSFGSGWSLYWTIRLAALGIGLAVAVGGFVYKKVTGNRIAGVTDQLDDDDDWGGEKPLSCAGNDVINASNVKASFPAGTAINASGNCKVTCQNCTLSSPFGIEATGNATVTLVGGSLDAIDHAISASGNARIEVRGTTVKGAVSRSGNATIAGLAPAASATPSGTANAALASAPSAAPRAGGGAPTAATKPTAAPKPSASAKKK